MPCLFLHIRTLFSKLIHEISCEIDHDQCRSPSKPTSCHHREPDRSVCSPVFELGLLDLKTHLVDILDRPGGQCTELYPEKPIYDIPGLPHRHRPGSHQTGCSNRSSPSIPNSISARSPRGLEKLDDGRWKLKTDSGTEIVAPVVVIAAGGGNSVPKRPPVGPGIEAFENAGEGIGVHYAVRKMETFRGKNILVAGGGDSALDWTLNLAPIAGSHSPFQSITAMDSAPPSTASTRCAH